MNIKYDSTKVEEIKKDLVGLNSATSLLEVNDSKNAIANAFNIIQSQVSQSYTSDREKMINFPEAAQQKIKGLYNHIEYMEKQIEKYNNGGITRPIRWLEDVVMSVFKPSKSFFGMVNIISATTDWFKGKIDMPELLRRIGIGASIIFTPFYATIDIISMLSGTDNTPALDNTRVSDKVHDIFGDGDNDVDGNGDNDVDGNGDNDGDGNGTYVTPSQPENEEIRDSSAAEEANTDIGKTDEGKSGDNPSTSTDKTEPSKDTDNKTKDNKDSDNTFENKPKPDNPPTISDNKGSSGVSHGGSSSNSKDNYTFTNSGISASQDEPIEILTDEKPGDDQITSLPDDNEDIYTIPTDLSGVTSTKKHSSGGGSGVIPILGGLGAAAAVGVGAKIYMDNKKNNDNDEDSSESDDNTEDWNETSNENDGILADEWNEDDSNFEFDDSEPNMDDDESGFGEI